MRILHLILLIIAALCFIVAFLNPGAVAEAGTWRRWNLVAAGLFAWVLVPLSTLIEDMAND